MRVLESHASQVLAFSHRCDNVTMNHVATLKVKKAEQARGRITALITNSVINNRPCHTTLKVKKAEEAEAESQKAAEAIRPPSARAVLLEWVQATVCLSP
jgi:hypothetical protein